MAGRQPRPSPRTLKLSVGTAAGKEPMRDGGGGAAPVGPAPPARRSWHASMEPKSAPSRPPSASAAAASATAAAPVSQDSSSLSSAWCIVV